MYICPLCKKALQLHESSKGYYCESKHHFDLAKEGYLHLLPVQKKGSKDPGDNRQMMRARMNFLEAGYYADMAKKLAEMIDSQRQDDQTLTVLDMGCGDGYYSRQIQSLCRQSDRLQQHGLDIAKNAILYAAKKQETAKYIVASSNEPPYSDHYFDLILRIYAPANDQELSRILKPGGMLLLVTPGPRHLWQLREHIYKKVNEHSLEVKLPEGFSLIESQRLTDKITPDKKQRKALLQMTPFAWRASEKIQRKIDEIETMEIETDFVLTLAKQEKQDE